MPFGRQPVVRPPAKPFNAEEARQLGLPAIRKPSADGQVLVEMGSHRFVNGYTERTVAIKVRQCGGGRVKERAGREDR